MVWHAYLLNPRCFFEDCIRYGKIDFFATPLPWAAIDAGIDFVSFEVNGSDAAKNKFTSSTGLRWNNAEDSMEKLIQCGECGESTNVPWTCNSQWSSESKEMTPGNGYADGEFLDTCRTCRTSLTHDYLRMLKFKRDVSLCTRKDYPLPGTLLTADGGIPDAPQVISVGRPYNNFPNKMVKAGLDKKFDLYVFSDPGKTMDDVKAEFEKAITNSAFIKSTKGIRMRVLGQERNAIRRVMSRYWFNSSPFALDLSGAVIRQGSFVEKMHNIDWLHSPALTSTVERLIVKYSRFFNIMASNAKHMAVPTLDVDLAWHTHQLNPAEYHAFSVGATMKYIDHDDKIEETKLSDAFTWTSKKYAELYSEPYSECTCWYCEAVRETHTSKLDRFFKPSKKAAVEKLHEASTESDPLKSAHISAHNAVRDIEGSANAKVKMAELDRAYHKACAKARKKGKEEPKRGDFYAYYWGFPMYSPMCLPYGIPYGVGGGGFYASNPCLYSGSTGSYGNCAANTCGGMVAVGGQCGSGCSGSGGCGGKISSALLSTVVVALSIITDCFYRRWRLLIRRRLW